MAKADLIEKAKALGIENAEALTVSQLEMAISKEENKKSLFEKADTLGIETEGKTDEEISTEVAAAEEEAAAIQKEVDKQARNTELVAMLSEFLGITDIESLSQEEVKELLDKRLAADAKGEETPVVKAGKTDKSYKASNGKEYVFKADAPAAFRYLGVHQTQEKWIDDKDSMELMIAGNLSFLTFKK